MNHSLLFYQFRGLILTSSKTIAAELLKKGVAIFLSNQKFQLREKRIFAAVCTNK